MAVPQREGSGGIQHGAATAGPEVLLSRNDLLRNPWAVPGMNHVTSKHSPCTLASFLGFPLLWSRIVVPCSFLWQFGTFCAERKEQNKYDFILDVIRYRVCIRSCSMSQLSFEFRQCCCEWGEMKMLCIHIGFIRLSGAASAAAGITSGLVRHYLACVYGKQVLHGLHQRGTDTDSSIIAP